MKSMSDAVGNLEVLKRELDASSYDALVAVSSEGVREVGIATQTTIRDRFAFNGRMLFEKAKEPQEKAGMEFPFSHNGHSIGLQLHEHPSINAFEDTPDEVGMMSAIEKLIRWPGNFGCHMKDLYEITEHGPIRHSDISPNEEIFEI